MELSIIIVNWNCKKYLKDCIGSIKDSVQGLEYEIIIVDNASTDDSIEFISGIYRNLIIIKNADNLGFGGANNTGIRQCRGKYVLLLNPDVIMQGRAINLMYDFMKGRENVACVGCNIIDADGLRQMSYGTSSGILNEVFFKTIKHVKLLSKNIMTPIIDWLHNRDRKVEWISGACMFIRREAFEKAGYMDGNIFMYFDEVNLCKQFIRAGYEVWYLHEPGIIHFSGGSMSEEIDIKIAIVYRKSQLYFYKKWFYPWQYGIIRMFLIFRCIVNSIIGLIKFDKKYITKQILILNEVLKYK